MDEQKSLDTPEWVKELLRGSEDIDAEMANLKTLCARFPALEDRLRRRFQRRIAGGQVPRFAIAERGLNPYVNIWLFTDLGEVMEFYGERAEKRGGKGSGAPYWGMDLKTGREFKMKRGVSIATAQGLSVDTQ